MLRPLTLALAAALAPPPPPAAQTWQGLQVSPENRCSDYRREDYSYRQSVEEEIIGSQTGTVYGPYTGRTFASAAETDIEHIVAVSEGHDSGLCAQPLQLRRAFASDLLNLTLAAPEINRCGPAGKCGLDAGEWLPDQNRCWFAARVVLVRRKYGLTVDLREAQALLRVLDGCRSFALVWFRPDPARR